ncbi:MULTISPECIES: relaxase/mobilization nuclease domain-containing protein [Bacteroidota]|uniref:relaxase/mobilization nuclease domain-containing protein n=1 Tax=uncultured Sphingobacterium sp. TaxID=182688 RepID=UPI00259485AF|nr:MULTISPECIES: relaxase/mobilization nuclease domain-containing protein [Bacteroidota]
MVIVILGSTASFNGVGYNERKTADGRSQLLVAKNFGALELKGDNVTKQDYIDYFKDYSASNKRIKNPQFHAVISVEGREYNFEQLSDIAEKYLGHMGYSNNPYLIYAHSDTNNNHIHIVSSRVGQDGKKIDDSYENVRTQNFIAKSLNLDARTEFDLAMDKTKSYRFSTEGQFKFLMESQGYIVTKNDKCIDFYRSGVKQGELDLAAVSALLAKKEDYDAKRIAQVKQLFEKYKSGYDTSLKWVGEKRPGRNASSSQGRYTSIFADHMKKKFGLELVYHAAKNMNVYSYSILDHNKRQVYKGSEILDLKQLLESGRGEDRGQRSIEATNEQIMEAVDKGIGFVQLQKLFKEQGMILSKAGAVRVKGEIDPFMVVHPQSLKALKYQSRLIDANRYIIPGAAEARIIAKLSHVDASDVVITEDYSKAVLREKLNSVFFNQSDLKEAMKEARITVIKSGSEFFLVDNKEKIIVSATSILTNEEIQQLAATGGISQIIGRHSEVADPDKTEAKYTSTRSDYYNGPESDLVSLDEISNLIGSIHDENDPAESAARRRRRSR